MFHFISISDGKFISVKNSHNLSLGSSEDNLLEMFHIGGGYSTSDVSYSDLIL
jgi:hypothetical protein